MKLEIDEISEKGLEEVLKFLHSEDNVYMHSRMKGGVNASHRRVFQLTGITSKKDAENLGEVTKEFMEYSITLEADKSLDIINSYFQRIGEVLQKCYDSNQEK